MRFLIDENLPPLLADRLVGLGHDSTHIAESRLGAGDDEVLRLAGEQDRIVITRDKGMSEAVFTGSVAVPGFMLVRLPRLSREQTVRRVVDVVRRSDDVAGWIATILPRRVRKRRLPR